VTNSRRLGWERNVAGMLKVRNAQKYYSENLKERGHLEDLGVNVIIIRKCILNIRV
jgi:hypothetical protein